MVIAKHRTRSCNDKSSRESIRKRFNICAFKKKEKVVEDAGKVRPMLSETTHNSAEQPEEIWARCTKVIVTAAEQTLGIAKGTRRKDWFDDEFMQVVKRKNAIWLKMKEKRATRAVKKRDIEERRAANRIIRRKKREHQDNWLRCMEEDGNRRETRRFCQRVSMQIRGYNLSADFCRDKAGNLMTNPEEIKQR